MTEGRVHDGLKGIPPGTPEFALDALGDRGWHALRDLSLPAALLRRSALDHNSAFIRRLLGSSGALYAPHGKTSMSPELFQEQLRDGAWAITLATVSQVAAARRFGVSRILLANEVVDAQGLRWLAEERRRDPGFELFGYVDSEDGVSLWAEALGAPRVPLPLLLEVGFAGGRAGCRSLADVLRVARAVARTPSLSLRGVAGFEGIVHADSDAKSDAAVSAFVGQIRAAARELDALGLFAPGDVLLSAGGSAYYDLVQAGLGAAALERPFRVVLRSGCLLSHDDGTYARAYTRLAQRAPEIAALGGGPRPALELWADVLSRPEPTRAVAGLGKRDAAHDAGLPTPKLWFRPGVHEAPQPISGITTCGLNDQHALLDVAADAAIRPGDKLGFGISHPCLTFDRWRLLFVVDDAYRILGGVRTFF